MALTELLQNRTHREKADIKSQAIVDLKVSGKHKRGEVEIDILSTEKIEGGVEVFTRAYKNGKQLGFGADGSVDIERFRIFNPPVMVPDGTKKQIQLGVAFDNQISEEDNFREDPEEALKLSLVHTIQQVGKENTIIEKGKTGKTTDTFYPAAGANSPVDGNTGKSGAVWATVRSSATGDFASATDATDFIQGEWDGGGYPINRTAFCFDTSTIGSGKTISSSTFSLYSATISNTTETTYPANLALVQAILTSTANVVTGDFDLSHWGSTRFATDITLVTFMASSAYKDFALNASGVANVNMTGVSQFGIRPANDLDNNTPTARSYGNFYMADQTGTTNDPKLVVTYAANATRKNKLTLLGVA